jgi:tripartite-type tricarboxylate transporter receptor subunit TctC
MLEQPAFRRKLKSAIAVCKAADRDGSDHAVTGNDQRNGILAAGLADRSRRRTQLARDFAVASGPARSYAGDPRPYPPLEFRAPLRQREIETELRIGEVAPNLRADSRGQAIPWGEGPTGLRQKPDPGEGVAVGADAEHRERRRQPGLKIPVDRTHLSPDTMSVKPRDNASTALGPPGGTASNRCESSPQEGARPGPFDIMDARCRSAQKRLGQLLLAPVIRNRRGHDTEDYIMRTTLALVAVCTLTAAPQAAEAQAPRYAGKTVTIVVGLKPGGGYDATARLLARHLPKHIPGRPAVIVQNMPGANSIIAANHVFAVAKPDGLTIGTFNRNLVLAELTKVSGVKFEMTRFAWIGSAASETTILALRTDLPYKTFDELRKSGKTVVIGATGPGANTFDFPLLLKEFLGVDFKIVSGYSSSADIMLAIERKEVDGRAGSYTSLRPFIDRKLVRPLIRARAVEPGIEQLPVDENLAPNARAKAIMALRSAPEVIGRPYVMPQGTPDDAVRIMREAFAKTIKDPEQIAEAKKAKVELEFVDGDEALKIIREVLAQPKEIVDEFTKYVKFGE